MGRPITKSKEQREKDFRGACLRSGFSLFEILQLLIDWHGIARVDVFNHAGASPVSQSVYNSQSEESLRVSPRSEQDEAVYHALEAQWITAHGALNLRHAMSDWRDFATEKAEQFRHIAAFYAEKGFPEASKWDKLASMYEETVEVGK